MLARYFLTVSLAVAFKECNVMQIERTKAFELDDVRTSNLVLAGFRSINLFYNSCCKVWQRFLTIYNFQLMAKAKCEE